ncbi:hypothetical protein OKHIL_76800 [Mycolicibacterium mageritense]|nr:hypothetical protein [Ahrensia sp.]
MLTHARTALTLLATVGVVTAGSGCTDTGPASEPTTTAAGPTATVGQVTTVGFDDNTTLPEGTDIAAGTWQIQARDGTPTPPNALCQTATAEYPALTLGPANYTDATISVRFLPISGTEDQAAGIIFRSVDPGNYYVLRANALEGNVNFYQYTDGTRSILAEANTPVPTGQWQELRVEITGDTLTGYLDGTQIVQTRHDRLRSGRIGLWTKADSHTCFDDFTATAR